MAAAPCRLKTTALYRPALFAALADYYDSRKDEEWRQNTSAETEAANLKLAIQWEKENATSGDWRERSRRRKQPGPK